jgi:hypothetical protein
MNSSTSSSEAARFLKVFVLGALGLAAALHAGLLLVDPFATGRLTPFRHAAMFDTGPRMAHASRLKDTAFDAAIFGNSTLQLIKPERLNALTGLRFVQLTVPGSGVMEQNSLVARLAQERGDAIRAIIVGLDPGWCDPSRENRVLRDNPFPFWLYDASALRYALGLFRMESVEAAQRRFGLMRGRGATAAPDGFWDYELLPSAAGARSPANTFRLKPQPGPRHSASAGMADLIARAPPKAKVVFVYPPIFSPAEAAPDLARQRCKAELNATAARLGARVVDRWVDDLPNRDARNFVDHNHYRAPLARLIEQDIARALAGI